MTKKSTIISDAGPLIALAKTGNLHILERLFKKVKIPPEVFLELKIPTSRPGAHEFKKAIEETKWIEVSRQVKIPDVFTNSIDQGEAAAIILAKTERSVLLIDERRGRKIAQKEKVKITGIGSILIAAKKAGIIKQVSPIIEELTGCGYRISEALRKKILDLAGEQL